MNYNKVLLIGNITKDPQLSYTPSQTPVVKFGLAVNKKYKDKEKVCFVDCTAFGKTAENINKYCKKGNPIFVEGELEFETWTTQEGTNRSKHSIFVTNFQFLSKPEAKQSNEQEQTQEQPDILF